MAKKKNMVVDGTEQLEVLMGVKVPENVTNDDLPVDGKKDCYWEGSCYSCFLQSSYW